MVKHLFCALFLLALLCPAGGAAGEIHLYVASRSFDVAVAPVDEESKNAEEAILYTRRANGEEWEELGPCDRRTLPNGEVRFTKEIDVDHDGTFQYTSRPVVGGEVTNLPRPEDAPQAIVVIDTLAPTAEILQPAADFEARQGEKVTLAWTVADENLSDTPAALSYSTDGGKSWNLIRRELPAEGSLEWNAPADQAGPTVVRLAATDKAGNVGRALRQAEVAAPEPEVARVPETRPAAPAAPAASVEEPDTGPDGPEESLRHRDPNRSWLYYLMAVNLMRQNKPADALQYYWLSVKEDPEFVNAWADIALAYVDLGAYKTAREVVEQARDRAPERIDLFHLMGETYHAEGMTLLGKARSTEERMEAKGLIDQAVAWYGQALGKASQEWRLAEQAASFYRLGEVCYYVNMDRDGARAYWEKILELHSPTPNPDLILWSSKKDRPSERKRQESYIYQRVSLDAWQSWARGYLEQMDARERKGILDLMPAQRVASYGAANGNRSAASLSYSGNAMNPGREDGRSLFSLPAQLGSPDDIAACAGVSGTGQGYNGYQTTSGYGTKANFPAHMNQPSPVEGYSFYGKETRNRAASPLHSPQSTRRSRSIFSARREPEPPPADPYAFPQGGRQQAPWNSALPYGNEPATNW